LFPSVEAELVHPSVLTVKPPVAVNLFSEDLDLLDDAAARVAGALSGIAGLEDVATTSEPGGPEITVELDRERAAAMGVQADELSRSLRRQISGEIVGQFREEEERIDIRLRASESDRDRATEVRSLRFRLPDGKAVPVSALAAVSIARGPAAIYRSGGGRVATVSAKVVSGDLGGMLDRVRSSLGDAALPAGVVAELAGQEGELKVSYESLKLALALAVFMVYVVMAVQFESLRYPFVILLSVPLGLVGVVAALLLTGQSLSVLALIGAVMLAGIVVNNAIVLVDAINRRRRQGQALEEAIVGAGRERLRPILMTTATTVLALLPMALGLGAGDELRRPMAITVIGGLTVATLLTLVVIPCLYRGMTRDAAGAEFAGSGPALEDAGPGGAEGPAS
jgi:HAE1 family hydrophobic/amphiphilic exporter-1